MASLGSQLRRAREQRGVGLDEIAQTTKIGTRFLRALETDQYDQLPGGIFNKGFIRAYARAVGIDEDQAIADYVAATEPGVAKPDGAAPVTVARMVELRAEAERGDSGDLPWGAFALVLVLGALALAGWGLYSREHRSKEVRSEPSAAPIAANPTPAPASSSPLSTNAEANSSGSASGNPATVPTTAKAAPVAATAASLPAPVVPATAGSTAAATAALANPGYFSVRVNIREDSWVSISADGKIILQGRFLAPVEKSVKATKQVIVQTQNAGGLDFEVNGKSLPRQGKTDEVKTLIFGPDGLEAVQASKATATQQ
ncbi:MAG TPA: RodZ domain-containing protein [Terriglobales bacterium]